MKKCVDAQVDKKQGEYATDERAFRLLEAFSGVDEELIERCEEQGKVIKPHAFWKSAARYGSACAAVFCLLAVGALTWGGYHVGVEHATGGAMESAREEVGYDLGVETTGAAPEAEMYMEAADATAGNAEEKYTSESASSVVLENQKLDGVAVGTTESDVKNGAEYNVVPDSGEREETASGAESDCAVSPEMKSRGITLEEAYKVEGLGEYIPTVKPAGYELESVYVLESAGGDTKESPQRLTLCWSRGMDSIFWSISREDAADLNIVDVDKTETYDEYLYEIPHAETVPEEYWEIFSNPVCKSEDFSLKFVEKRMISRGGDAGDTDTPRGSFSVLYPDGIVVNFKGRGTAEEVWEMFSSFK